MAPSIGRDKHPCMLCKNTAPFDCTVTKQMLFRLFECKYLIVRHILIKFNLLLWGNCCCSCRRIHKQVNDFLNDAIWKEKLENMVSFSVAVSPHLNDDLKLNVYIFIYIFIIYNVIIVKYYTIYWYQPLSVPVVVVYIVDSLSKTINKMHCIL